MSLIDRLKQSLDPLRGTPVATREEFAHWYRQAKLPQIRSGAFLTMLLYFVYTAIEQHVAQDHQQLRLLVHGLLVPAVLLAVGLMSYSEAWRQRMILLLCAAPISAVLANLAFNSGNSDFAYFLPEIYLNLMWTFTVSGLNLRQATLTASISTVALVVVSLGAELQDGLQWLHLGWILASLSFGFVCAFVLEKAHKIMFLHQRQLALSASLDGLTGLWNRTHIDQLFSDEIARAQRYDTRFSVILIDIDHFKQVNDSHGHAVGDSVLRQFAKLLSNSVRVVDQVGRLGGEEFLVILPEADQQQALAVAKTLQRLVRECEFKTVRHKTASFGVTEFCVDDSAQSMLDRADRALYLAKANGRDRIEVL
ncbi:GGDEF domain-containing protein [Pseudomonas sp. BMS12]|uniref:GGDEF domain-containing protein n=1 Tax=Pseudomonas sp. BMS12 TaxID=1796033 RepID=UPI000B1581FA|nr:GGDEF domain-containing protein [Pseudomonas sp. BMS12]